MFYWQLSKCAAYLRFAPLKGTVCVYSLAQRLSRAAPTHTHIQVSRADSAGVGRAAPGTALRLPLQLLRLPASKGKRERATWVGGMQDPRGGPSVCCPPSPPPQLLLQEQRQPSTVLCCAGSGRVVQLDSESSWAEATPALGEQPLLLQSHSQWLQQDRDCLGSCWQSSVLRSPPCRQASAPGKRPGLRGGWGSERGKASSRDTQRLKRDRERTSSKGLSRAAPQAPASWTLQHPQCHPGGTAPTFRQMPGFRHDHINGTSSTFCPQLPNSSCPETCQPAKTLDQLSNFCCPGCPPISRQRVSVSFFKH